MAIVNYSLLLYDYFIGRPVLIDTGLFEKDREKRID